MEAILTHFLAQFDPSKHEKMIEVYTQSLEKHTKVCEQAMASRDAHALQSSAHDLKSLCFILGVDDAGRRAERIELALKNQKAQEVQEAISQTPALLADVQEILKVMRARAGRL